MTTSTPTADPSLQAHTRRVGKSLADLNARIARLALLVGASLGSEDDIERIVHRQVPLLQHPAADASAASSSGTGRRAQQWEELRGLLVLRCDMMKQVLNDLGLELTEQLVSQAEEHLERIGFKRGADGFSLLPRREP